MSNAQAGYDMTMTPENTESAEALWTKHHPYHDLVYVVKLVDRTPLLFAAMKGDLATVRAINAEDGSIEARNSEGYTPLCAATLVGNHVALRTLIQAGANLEARESNWYGRTALLIATTTWQSDVVSILVKAGARIFATTSTHETALELAVTYLQDDVARILIETGAYLEGINRVKCKALLSMAVSQQWSITRVLRAARGSVSTLQQQRPTSLMVAVETSNVESMRQLITAGASLDEVQEFGRTALGQAVALGHLACVQILLAAGADVEGHTPDGAPLLVLAAESKHKQAAQIAELLIQAGALLSTTKSILCKKTALHIAAEQGHVEIVRLLINSGASSEVQDENGFTPVQLAGQRGHFKAVLALIKAGTTVGSKNDLHIEKSHANAVQNNSSSYGKSAIRAIFRRRSKQTSNAQTASRDISTNQEGTDSFKIESDIPMNQEVTASSFKFESDCREIRQFLKDCTRLRKCFSDSRMIVRAAANTHAAFNDLRLLLDRLSNTTPVTRFLIRPAVRALSSDLLVLMNELSQLNDTNSGCDSTLISNIAHHQDQTRMFLLDWYAPTSMKITAATTPSAEMLMLLSYDCDQRKFKYTSEELYMMHAYLRNALRLSQCVIPRAPKWFIPLYDIDVSASSSWFIETTTHQGAWSGVPVGIEQVNFQAEKDFAHGIELQLSLNHPHVLNLLGAFHLGDRPLIVYRLLQPLEEYLSGWLTVNKSTDISLLLRLIRQKLHEVSLALAYLHEKQIVHGSLKPRHLVVDKQGEAQVVLAFPTDYSNKSRAGEASKLAFATDVYDLGIAMIEILSEFDSTWKAPNGKREFSDEMEMEMKQFWSLLQQMCASKPLDRCGAEYVAQQTRYFSDSMPNGESVGRQKYQGENDSMR